MTEKFKLVYREYGKEIIIVSNDEEPLLMLLKSLITREPDFDLQFYGDEKLDKLRLIEDIPEDELETEEMSYD